MSATSWPWPRGGRCSAGTLPDYRPVRAVAAGPRYRGTACTKAASSGRRRYCRKVSWVVGLIWLWYAHAIEISGEWLTVSIDFKGVHFPKAVILHAVFFYVRYAVSYRDLEEIKAERGV